MIYAVFCQFPFGHDIVCLFSVSLWPLDNIMAKEKLKKTTNIMAKGKLTKDRQYHGQRETDKGHVIVCRLSVSLWP
jgi:hypothetical protein